MAYIYQADVWCDDCGRAIMADIALEHPDLVPEDPEDEGSYDSDDYPKRYDPDSSESDGPENCADGRCAGEYGTFLGNGLTSEGYQYLKSMLDEHGPELPPHAREWAEAYDFHYVETCETCEMESDECQCETPVLAGEWRSGQMF